MRAVGRIGVVASMWVVLLLCMPSPVGSTHAGTDDILLITFDNTGENNDNDATLVHQILTGFTYTVTHLLDRFVESLRRQRSGPRGIDVVVKFACGTYSSRVSFLRISVNC